MQPIAEIGERMGLDSSHVIPYGRFKAKVPLEAIKIGGPRGALIVVTGITPTPAGEGKTTISVGLTQGLGRMGKQVVATLREPSLGPIFGIKGGGTGGGASLVEPEDEVNIHFTGDAHAVASAHNLLAAMTDNAVQRGQIPGFYPPGITWRRVLEMEDRSMRSIVTGIGGQINAPLRETGFDIVTASEIMAILALSGSLEDLRTRLGRMVVGFNTVNKPVTALDVGAVGSMMALLRFAIQPNLVQTTEGQPVVVHTGPFGNIAHGCSSVLADRLALGYADYVVTEVGFGSDLGFEKFMHIKARYNDLEPRAAVLVASVRALKSHGGVRLRDLSTPNEDAVMAGMPNLEHHVRLVKSFGVPVVVAVNVFPPDSPEEIALVKQGAMDAGAFRRRRKQSLCPRRRGWRRARRGRGGGVKAGKRRFVSLPPEREPAGEDPRPCAAGLQRRRRGLGACRPAAVERLRGTGLGEPPHLYGQDPPLHIPQRSAQRPALRLHLPHRKRQGLGGSRLHLPHRRKHRHHAGATPLTTHPGRGRRRPGA